jgi:hypothetical protein
MRRSFLAMAMAVGPLVAIRVRSRNWGATAEEVRSPLPGDELIPDSAITVTRGVTVEAPAEAVWPWLVQIGHGRGGMYSYDRLENLIGLDIHSAAEIRPEWQHLGIGDRVTLVRPGWFGIAAGYSLPVVQLLPGRALVLRQSPPEHPWNAVWSFHVRPLDRQRCRLLSRGRAARHGGWRGWIDFGVDAVMDPVTLVMTRKMLLGIKVRAETSQRATPKHALAPSGGRCSSA